MEARDDSEASSGGMITPFSSYAKCNDHANELLDNFCKKCEVFVCPDCIETKHVLHELCSAKSQVRKLHGNVESQRRKLEALGQQQIVKVLQFKDAITRQKDLQTQGLKIRTQREAEALKHLEDQRSSLVDHVNAVYQGKQDSVKKIVSESTKEFNQDQDRRVADLSATVSSIENEKDETERLVRRYIDLPGSPTQIDLLQVFPHYQRIIKRQHLVMPDVFHSPISPPDLEAEKDLNLKLVAAKLSGREFVKSWLSSMYLGESTDADAVFIKKKSLQELCNVRDGSEDVPLPTLKGITLDEACLEDDLVSISQTTMQELRQILKVEPVLQCVENDDSKQMLRELTGGEVTHVLARARERKDEEWVQHKNMYLPVNVTVQEAINTALGFTPSKALDAARKAAFTGQRVETKNVKEWYDGSARGRLSLWQ